MIGQNKLIFSFSGGEVVIYPFLNDNLDGEKSKEPYLSTFKLPRPIYAFVEFENTHLIGAGYEGHLF
jgi:hypothetical protein